MSPANACSQATTELGLSAQPHDKVLRVPGALLTWKASHAFTPTTSVKRSCTAGWIGNSKRFHRAGAALA